MVNYFISTCQAVPDNPFGFVKIAMESLAMTYRYCLDQLKEISLYPIDSIHIIGGGSKNETLNQYTANATGKEVFSGPNEATSIGNIIVQAKAQGYINSMAEARQIIKDSFPIKKYSPQNGNKWDRAYQKYREILNEFKLKGM